MGQLVIQSAKHSLSTKKSNKNYFKIKPARLGKKLFSSLGIATGYQV